MPNLPGAGSHTVKAFDSDLVELRGLVSEMGARAESAMAGAMRALDLQDEALIARICDDDARIDALEQTIDQQVVTIIALRAPMADDLRELFAVLKISSMVERIGDYAKNIARRSVAVPRGVHSQALDALPAMADGAAGMVHDALTAFAMRDAELADRVCARDSQIDELYNRLFRLLVASMVDHPDDINAGAHLLFIAKNLERIADHATNIAEMVHYSVTGEKMPERARVAQFENL